MDYHVSEPTILGWKIIPSVNESIYILHIWFLWYTCVVFLCFNQENKVGITLSESKLWFGFKDSNTQTCQNIESNTSSCGITFVLQYFTSLVYKWCVSSFHSTKTREYWWFCVHFPLKGFESCQKIQSMRTSTTFSLVSKHWELVLACPVQDWNPWEILKKTAATFLAQ